MKQKKHNNFSSAILSGFTDRLSKLFRNPYRPMGMNPLTLKYYKHLPPARLHSHKLLGKPTWFYGGGEYIHALKEVFLEEAYMQKLPANAVILDCGAHIGMSVIYLKSICPTAEIIAFEPDQRNFELLKKNVRSHDLQNVQLRMEAVWIENTTIRFIEEGNMGSKIGAGSAEKSKEVTAIRLRDFLDRHIDFLKIDIEGAEYEVLNDIQHDLDKVGNLFIEYHGTFSQNHQLNEILQIVTTAGFAYYIKEAAEIFQSPFARKKRESPYDLQLNIFCFRIWISPD